MPQKMKILNYFPPCPGEQAKGDRNPENLKKVEKLLTPHPLSLEWDCWRLKLLAIENRSMNLDEMGPSNSEKMAPLTQSLEWDCWRLGLLAIEYEETVENCALDLENWKCKRHDCELKRIIRKGSKWAKLKTGLYGKKSTSETVWICKESLRQLYEGAAPAPSGKICTATQRMRSRYITSQKD